MRGVIIFFHSYANVKRNVTYTACFITTEFDYAKRDSRHEAYGGVVLQRFNFIKVCMGWQRFLLEKSIIRIFCE